MAASKALATSVAGLCLQATVRTETRSKFPAAKRNSPICAGSARRETMA